MYTTSKNIFSVHVCVYKILAHYISLSQLPILPAVHIANIIIIMPAMDALLCCLLYVANKDTGNNSSTNLQTPRQQVITVKIGTSSTHDYHFSNPLYAEPVKDSESVTEARSTNQMQQSSSK